MERVAIVIAGGSGMGAEAARRLASDGYRVAVLSSSGKAEELAREIGGIGFTGSNQSADDLERFVKLAMASWGRIDVVVNSAGHGPRGEITALTDEDWQAGFDVYLLNVVRATRLVTPIMQSQRSGVIINISTAWALEPTTMFPTSTVFRAALATYTKLFSDTHAKDNIRMNNILPGWIDSFPAEENLLSEVPMGRIGKMSEIAATIAFLASDGAGYITGQNIKVDGGLMRSVI